MKGARALGIGFLVLAAAVATPAISAAQDEAAQDGATASPDAPALEQAPSPLPDTDNQGKEANRPVRAADGEAEQAGQPAAPAEQPAAAPEPASIGAVASASARVSIGDNFYSPPNVSIAVGDIVTWTNDGQVGHTVTFDDGSYDTGVFGPGGSRSRTFRSAGTFSYYCTVHGRSQSGTVRVAGAGGGGRKGGGGGASGVGIDGISETDAVASPGAAGSDTFLPATGLAALGLAAIGLALLGGGIAIRHLDSETPRRRPRLRFPIH